MSIDATPMCLPTFGFILRPLDHVHGTSVHLFQDERIVHHRQNLEYLLKVCSLHAAPPFSCSMARCVFATV